MISFVGRKSTRCLKTKYMRIFKKRTINYFFEKKTDSWFHSIRSLNKIRIFSTYIFYYAVNLIGKAMTTIPLPPLPPAPFHDPPPPLPVLLPASPP